AGGYLALAVPLVLLTLPFVLATPDYPLPPERRAPLSVRVLIGSYWVDPRRHPGLPLAWVTPFLAAPAIRMGAPFPLSFLRDQVHPATLPGHSAKQALFILIAIYTGFVVVTAIVGGVLSDRAAKRKMIVTLSGALMGAAALLLTFVETWPAAMAAAVLFG